MRAPLDRMSKQVTRFVDVSGLRKVAQGFEYIWKAAGSVLRTLTQIVPVLGTITGAATIAGMVKLVQSYAAWAHELVATASGIGLTTEQLQTLQDATRIMGGNANDMTESLKGLHDTLSNMATGTGNWKEAEQQANAWGISLRDANGHAKTLTEQGFKDVIQKLKDIKNPTDRARAAIELLGPSGARLVESLRQSTISLDDAARAARSYLSLTDQQIGTLQRFTEAQGKLGVGVDRLGQQISVMLAEQFTPMLEKFDEFVKKNTPAILDATKQVTDAFGGLWQSVAGDTSGEQALKNLKDNIVELVNALKWLVEKGNDVATTLNRLTNLNSKNLTAPIIPKSEGGDAQGNAPGAVVVPSQGLPGPALRPEVKDFFEKMFDRIMRGPENIRPGFQKQSSAGGYLPGGVTLASYGGGGGAAAMGGGFGGGEFFVLLSLAVTKGFEDAINHLRGAGGAPVGGGGGTPGGMIPASYIPGGGGRPGPSPGGGPPSAIPASYAPPGGASLPATSAAPASAGSPAPPPGSMNLPQGTVQRGGAITARLASDLNLTPQQAAGITGNLQAESGIRAVQEGHPISGRGGFGWAQWTGPRRVAFERYAKENNLDPKSDEANYGFLKKELQSPEYAGMLKQLGALKGPNAAREAAALFERLFERPKVSNAGVRGKYAEQFVKNLPPAAPPGAVQPPAPPPAAPGAGYKTLTQEQLTGEKQSVPIPQAPVNGSVDVSITHKNAPPNSAVTATGSGSVNVAPVRVEHQDMADI